MIIEYNGRAMGKTYKCVQWLLEDRKQRKILTFCHQEKQRLINQYALLPSEIITMDDIKNMKLKGIHQRPEISIDNLDLIMEYLTGCKIHISTITKEE